MILGLDMATKKTGYGLLDAQANLYDYGIIRTTSEEPRERIKEVYDAIERIINENNITEFYITGADATACIKSTCYNMAKLGYSVNVFSDCITSYDKKKLCEMFKYYTDKGCTVTKFNE